MKLPNGYGSVIKLGGNRRKPFAVRITTGYTDEGKQKFAYLGYNESRKQALVALAGMRPGEILEVKTEDVYLDERYLRGGFKTEAGTNRVIPIHRDIHKFVEELVLQGHEYLITNNENKQMKYHNFHYDHFKKTMEQLELKLRPHDCRHTFATLMDNCGANKLSIKRIMGHASKDITDKVYTHKDIQQLLIAIDMLKL